MEEKIFRGQTQLYLTTEDSSGIEITEQQVKEFYGDKVLKRLNSKGVAPILKNSDEPQYSIKSMMDVRGINNRELSSLSGVPESEIEIILSGKRTNNSFQSIAKICSELGIDDDEIGTIPISEELEKIHHLTANLFTLQLDEYGSDLRQRNGLRTGILQASRLIDTEIKIRSKLLKETIDRRKIVSDIREIYQSTKYKEYNQPYEEGYALADATREYLNIISTDPIQDAFNILVAKLKIPVVYYSLPESIAGITINTSNNNRGIVINLNLSPFVIRTAIFHELCHYLFDEEEEYGKIHLDRKGDLLNQTEKQDSPPMEKRARAFAVEFLLPRQTLKKLLLDFSQKGNPHKANYINFFREISLQFGISNQALKYHAINNTERPERYSFSSIFAKPIKATEEAKGTWYASSVSPLLDFFENQNNYSRSGSLLFVILEAYNKKVISLDSASIKLNIDKQRFLAIQEIYKINIREKMLS